MSCSFFEVTFFIYNGTTYISLAAFDITSFTISADDIVLKTTNNTASSGSYSGSFYDLTFDCENKTYNTFVCSSSGSGGSLNKYVISNVRENGLYKVRFVNNHNVSFTLVGSSTVGTFKFSYSSISVAVSQHIVLTFFHIDGTTYVSAEEF